MSGHVIRQKALPLQLKLTVTLLLIVLVPLGVSAYLMGDLGAMAANFGANEAAARARAIEQQIAVYHDLVNTSKRLHGEIATRLATRPDLLALDAAVDLAAILNSEAGLRKIELIKPDGIVEREAEKPRSREVLRDHVVQQPLGAGGAILQLTFEVIETQAELQNLKLARDLAKEAARIRTALPEGSRTAFLVLIGISGAAAAAFGVWASRFVTRRIEALVSTARKVSEGHHDARVKLRGDDEMAELGSAFNTMLDDLDQARGQVEYLQRMGVWQDVARRLAHEIKNPLTPIQLAVQQCVSSYNGDDVRHKKLLADTGEIVEEEIAGLRRLVDTFRTLGALPKVEAAPLALAEVIEELKLDPAMAPHLELQPPGEAVTVRADKLLLKRVLVNLVENGIQAGQEAGRTGRVVVGWAPRGDRVEITVDDQCKGVPDTHREKIFEPYVTTKATGTGLGLAIARKLALEHGGELAVDPQRAPTGGARFVLSLRLRGADSSMA